MGCSMNVRALNGGTLAKEGASPRSRADFESISVRTSTAKQRGSFIRLRAALPLKTNGLL
jgi:hypothetical protein